MMSEIGFAICDYLNARLKPQYLASIKPHNEDEDDANTPETKITIDSYSGIGRHQFITTLRLTGNSLLVPGAYSPYRLIDGTHTVRHDLTIDFNDPLAFATLDGILQTYYKPSIETLERTSQ